MAVRDFVEYALDEFIDSIEPTSGEETRKQLNLLVDNGLGVVISGKEDVAWSYGISKYKVASVFMCKHNKKNKKHMKDERTLGPDAANQYIEDNIPELVELSKSGLETGIYYAILGKKDVEDKNCAVLFVTAPDADDSDIIQYELYLVGKKCNKYKNKFFDMVNYYKELKKETVEQRIYYTDGSPTKIARFKPFDQVVFSQKKEVLEYIDNWVNNIPEYYAYGMTPKLSVLLYGKPGTGKSTFYKALADYLKIPRVTCVSPSQFAVDDKTGRDRGNRAPAHSPRYFDSIYAIDDIDCICNSRETDESPENSQVLSNLLAWLDNPDTMYYKAKDGIYYPISIVVATTNYYDRLDSAVKRYGRFDLQIEMNEFSEKEAKEMCDVYGLKLKDVVTEKITKDFTISPAKLQALCLEKIDKGLKEK